MNTNELKNKMPYEKRQLYEKNLNRLFIKSKKFYRFMKDLMEHLKEDPDIYYCPYNDFDKILGAFRDFDENVNDVLNVFDYYRL